MTLAEIIGTVKKLKPSQYPDEAFIGWLSNLDAQIFREIFLSHRGRPVQDFSPYTPYDMDKDLLVPEPYAFDIYNHYLQAQIDRENGEMNKYNQSITLYNNAYSVFQAYWNRTHMPISGGRRFLW